MRTRQKDQWMSVRWAIVPVQTEYDAVFSLFENADLFAPVAFVLAFGHGFPAFQAVRFDCGALFAAIDDG